MLLKKFDLWSLAVSVILGLLLAAAVSSESVLFDQVPAGDKPLRLHVLANSDDPLDQEIKLAVRDHIITQMSPLLSSAESKEDAMLLLSSHTDELTRSCNQFLAFNGMPYKAVIRIERTDFPEIAYDNAVFAAGEYDALRVILGEGAGHNWWCVLFPPLCFVDLAGEFETVNAMSVLSEYEEYEEYAASPQIRWKLGALLP